MGFAGLQYGERATLATITDGLPSFPAPMELTIAGYTMTTMINTHRLVKRLTSEGKMSEQAAEAVSEAINEALADSVATKADITALRTHIDTVETRLSNKLYGVGLTVVIALGVIQHFFK